MLAWLPSVMLFLRGPGGSWSSSLPGDVDDDGTPTGYVGGALGLLALALAAAASVVR
jgi:MYXO-CTERM domain-containing protein